MRQVINKAAAASIAPYTVELELKKHGVIKQDSITELFGVPITDE